MLGITKHYVIGRVQMNLKKYNAYIKVVETGSLTKAAEMLNYTQPGISQMISTLEEEYGFPLLIRQKNGVTPTKNGLSVLHAMFEIQRGYERLTETVNEINGLETGTIRLGAYTSITTNWLPEIIREFKTIYPRIEIQVYEGTATELEYWLEKDIIDFAIGTTLNDKWHFETLVKDPIVAIMSSNHELVKLDSLPLEVVETTDFILPYTNTFLEIHEIFKKERIKPKISYQIKGDNTIISMVKNNLGISLVPKLLLSGYTNDIVIKPLERDFYRQVGIFMNTEKNSQTPSVNKIIHFINEWINKKKQNSTN